MEQNLRYCKRCDKSHPFTREYFYPTPKGSYICLICRRAFATLNRPKHKDYINMSNKRYWAENKNKEKARLAIYRAENAELIRIATNRRHKQKTGDQQYMWARKLRASISNGISVGRSDTFTGYDLGCTWLMFKQHMESLFRDGMSWENYGRGGWEVDHIKSLNCFDLSDPEQRKLAGNYTNIQPLWQKENRQKRTLDMEQSRIEREVQKLKFTN